ncbi:phage regulatory protein/antirepressor Ant [Paracoccus denitrificans]|uniref:phage antirepressor KilAC domain-containing protein n=1 Tax=Paracoccus denitrificans TaxID=266 RepID=UPI001E4CC99D|nr:phage regulatory protein/antirepressor Ant [Paracoccus denitrificans]UFS64872.1 phage regulatory protein/antirepressor Ant [Paracoccus denitrificans]
MKMEHNRPEIKMPAIIGGMNEPLTMSSREIADLCEKRHDHVMRDVKKMLADLGMSAPKFGGSYVGADGTQRPCFNLPKDLTLTLVAGYNVVLRKRIIDRWLELEGQGVPAMLTGPQLMAAALIEADATMKAQAAQIESMQEDVEALDRIAKADGSLCITDAAKALQMRPKELFGWLRENGWIYRRPGSGHDLGYQSKTAAGLLEHKVTTVLRADGSEKVTEQVRVTPRGLEKLAKLVFPAAKLIGGAA